MKLYQKALLEKRSFFLLPNKLKTYIKNTEGEYENYIAYESLKGESKVFCRKNSNLLFLTLATSTFAMCIVLHTLLTNQDLKLVIFPLIVATFFATMYYTRQQNYTTLETFDRQKVVLLHNNPNRKALERFLNQLWMQRKQYLREKYFYISQYQDQQKQTDRLRWLLEQNVISNSEFKFAQEDWVIDRSYQSN